jgi:hypothetical protein
LGFFLRNFHTYGRGPPRASFWEDRDDEPSSAPGTRLGLEECERKPGTGTTAARAIASGRRHVEPVARNEVPRQTDVPLEEPERDAETVRVGRKTGVDGKTRPYGVDLAHESRDRPTVPERVIFETLTLDFVGGGKTGKTGGKMRADVTDGDRPSEPTPSAGQHEIHRGGDEKRDPTPPESTGKAAGVAHRMALDTAGGVAPTLEIEEHEGNALRRTGLSPADGQGIAHVAGLPDFPAGEKRGRARAHDHDRARAIEKPSGETTAVRFPSKAKEGGGGEYPVHAREILRMGLQWTPILRQQLISYRLARRGR